MPGRPKNAKFVEHGWSRQVLVYRIESRLYKRQGKVVTNFRQTLPVSAREAGSGGFCTMTL